MTQLSPSGIEIKGTQWGLALSLGTAPWSEIMRDLQNRLLVGDTFFHNSQVRLETDRRALTEAELREIVGLLGHHGVRVHSVLTRSEATASAVQQMGLRIALPDVPALSEGSRPLVNENNLGVVIRGTLRSGQAIRHRGHVVIIGDVNPGAEVVAGGDIVVWGRARGMLHAGAAGDEQAVVCALVLQPTQLRIGSLIAVSPDTPPSQDARPEVACAQDRQIVALPWSGSGRQRDTGTHAR